MMVKLLEVFFNQRDTLKKEFFLFIPKNFFWKKMSEKETPIATMFKLRKMNIDK